MSQFSMIRGGKNTLIYVVVIVYGQAGLFCFPPRIVCHFLLEQLLHYQTLYTDCLIIHKEQTMVVSIS